MIRSVKIRDFESHEDTSVEFCEGFNLLVGPSNAGKSSVIRAIAVAVDNLWDKGMVRVGADHCAVRVETERGWVECERGEKVNTWRCMEYGAAPAVPAGGDPEGSDGSDSGLPAVQEYKSVGTGVPEQASRILGMMARRRGPDIRELPNFQFQLERHYMLSEIDGKKATSNMIARMMDGAIGLGGMEELLKAISTDLARDRKWLSERQSEISEAREAVMDGAIFDGYRSLVDEIGRIDAEARSDAGLLEAAGGLSGRLEAASSGLVEAKAAEAALGSVGEMAELSKWLDDRYSELEAASSLLEAFRRDSGRLGELEADVPVDCMEALVSECQLAISAVRDMERGAILAGELGRCAGTRLDMGPLEEALSGSSDAMERVGDASSMLDNIRKVWSDGRKAGREAASAASELEAAERRLESLRSSLGVCPLCGASLSGDGERPHILGKQGETL